jgi:hypothetical protein
MNTQGEAFSNFPRWLVAETGPSRMRS